MKAVIAPPQDPRMVYGVSKCRRCGTPIMSRHVNVTEENVAARRDLVPEKVWRRQGLLVAPSGLDLKRPSRGMCQRCAQITEYRITGMKVGVVLLVCGTIAMVIWLTVTGVPQ